MVYDAITYLIYTLVVVALAQPDTQRRYAAVVFASAVLSHELFFSHTTGLWYYGSAALVDLLVIVLTSGIEPIPRMVLRLHTICIVSMVANAAGWVIWFLYLPPLAYDLAFVAINGWALCVLVDKGGKDVGGFALRSRATCFRGSRSTRAVRFNKYKGEI